MNNRAGPLLALLGALCLGAAPARSASQAAAASHGIASLANLDPRGGTLKVNLSGFPSTSFDLKPVNVLDPQATVTTTNGAGILPLQFRPTIYRGRSAGSPDDWAVVSVSDHATFGLVVVGGRTFNIRSAPAGTAEQLQLEPARATPFECATQDPRFPATLRGAAMRVVPGPQSSLPLVCHLAIDCDYELVQSRFSGDSLAAAQYVLMLIAEVSHIYARDINVSMRVSYLNFWMTPKDPYDEITIVQMADQFRDYWRGNRSNVRRDIAYLLSGRLAGGDAPGGLCDSSKSYAASGVFGPDSHPVDVRVMAHELGHIFGSPHTFSCFWQAHGYIPPGALLDSCGAGDDGGGCYSGPGFVAPPGGGTIMDYCYPFQLRFHRWCRFVMRAYADTSCLEPESVQLLLRSPARAERWQIGSRHRISWFRNTSVQIADLTLSRDLGAHWESLGENVTGVSFDWQVVGPPTSEARLRIATRDLAGVVDSSAVDFEIVAQPQFLLWPLAPNPTGDALRIRFSLAENEPGRLELFDSSGRRRKSIAVAQAGENIVWVAHKGELHAGIYFVRLSTARQSARQKIVIVH